LFKIILIKNDNFIFIIKIIKMSAAEEVTIEKLLNGALALLESSSPDKMIKFAEGVLITEVENNKLKTLTTRLPDIPLNKVCIGQSKISGRGLFATEQISKGTIITLYPGDLLLYYFEPNDIQRGKKYGVIPSDHLTSFDEDNIVKDMEKNNLYKFDINDRFSIVGHPDLIDDPAYLGHICNDGARSNCPGDRFIYESISSLKSNASLDNILDMFIPVVASKDIKIGEEILVSYGYKYWRNIYWKK